MRIRQISSRDSTAGGNNRANVLPLRKQYGGMNTNDAKKLMLLEKENIRLKRIIANQAVDI